MTSEIDVTTMNTIESAAAAVDGTPEAAARFKAALVGHTRFKQPQFVALDDIRGVGRNLTGGTIEIATKGDVIKVKVPNREQLSMIADSLVALISSTRAST